MNYGFFSTISLANRFTKNKNKIIKTIGVEIKIQ